MPERLRCFEDVGVLAALEQLDAFLGRSGQLVLVDGARLETCVLLVFQKVHLSHLILLPVVGLLLLHVDGCSLHGLAAAAATFLFLLLDAALTPSSSPSPSLTTSLSPLTPTPPSSPWSVGIRLPWIAGILMDCSSLPLRAQRQVWQSEV